MLCDSYTSTGNSIAFSKHVSSKVFQKNQGSHSVCFRSRQESWRPITYNASCSRQQNFRERCDCSCLAKLQTHLRVKSFAFSAATVDNSLAAAKVSCWSQESSGTNQKTSQTLLGLPSLFSSLRETKEGWALVFILVSSQC